MIAPGDQVKLTDRYAAALCKRPCNYVDWRTRRGIAKVCKGTSIGIIWPGRKSPDWVPIKGSSAPSLIPGETGASLTATATEQKKFAHERGSVRPD